MTPTKTGWTIFAVALTTMCGLLANDIGQLASWNEVYTPAFVSKILLHLGTVGAAFIGGKIIPSER